MTLEFNKDKQPQQAAEILSYLRSSLALDVMALIKEGEQNIPPIESIAPQYVTSDPAHSGSDPPDVLLCVFIHG